MPFNLTFSNSLCGLLGRFGQLVDEGHKSPFAVVNVIVTDIKSAETIKVSQAKQKGICANFNFLKIEEFIWKELSTLFLKINPQESCSYLTNDTLSFLIFEFLSSNSDFISKHSNLKKYLFGKNGNLADNSRIASLALKLANLYMEYQYNRPGSLDLSDKGVIQSWLKGELFFAPRSKDKKDICIANELWQMDIYNHIFGASGRINRLNKKTGSKHFTVSGIYNEIFVNNANLLGGLSDLKKDKIYLFDLKGLSLFHRQALFLMSEKLSYDINAFVINPCELYWEDTDTTNSRIRAIARGRKSSLFVDEYKDNYLLKNMGHTGKESVVLWLAATNYDYDFIACVDWQKKSLLRDIQRLVLENSGDVGFAQIAGSDSSIAMYEFDDMLSEVEHLYDSIVAVLEKSGDTKLDEVGVFIADAEAYLPIIEYVFTQKLNSSFGTRVKLEYSLSGLKVQESFFISGMEAFINLVRGDFSKKDFFSFFTNPLVISSLGVDFIEVDQWKVILNELNVFRFFSSNSKDSFEKSEIHTFSHGVKRLLLSQTTNVQYSDKSDTKSGNEGLDCYIPFSTLVDKGIFDNLIYAIERLGGDVNYLKKGRLPFCDTARFFIEFADTWFAKSDDFYGESLVKRKFKNSLKQLCDVSEYICEKGGFFHEKGLMLYISNLFRRESISAMSGYRGVVEINELKNGVFRGYSYIFICGLSESYYPSKNSEETVDLRNFSKQTGDVNRTRLDEYHFLEAILAAENGFYASYTGYDKKSDKEIAASSVLTTLKNYLGQICHHSSSNANIKKIFGYSKSLPVKDNSLFSEVRTVKSEANEILLNLSDISMYVNNPFRYFTAKILNIRDEENSNHSFSFDEFSQGDQFCKYSFLKDFYKEAIRLIFAQNSEIKKEQMNSLFDELFCKYSAEGFLPESIFLEIEKVKFKEEAESVASAVNLFYKKIDGDRGVEFLETLKIKASPIFSEYFADYNKKVLVRVKIENVVKVSNVFIIPIYSASNLTPDTARFYKELIEMYIAAAIFCATGNFSDIATIVVVVISNNGVAEYKLDINHGDMLGYLRARLEEMIIKENYDFTPSEVALEKMVKGEKFSAESLYKEFSNNYSYEKRRNIEIICDIDLTHDAQKLVGDRFGNLLQLFSMEREV